MNIQPLSQTDAKVEMQWNAVWNGLQAPEFTAMRKKLSIHQFRMLFDHFNECMNSSSVIAELAPIVQKVANLGEYREVVDAMANCLRPHERDGFTQMYRLDARAAIARVSDERGE